MAEPAWLLTPLGLPLCAVAQHEVMQYLNSAPAQPVPFTLRHCATAIFWQDDIVPVMNLSALNASPEPIRDLAVLAYQDTPGAPLHYVALALQIAPERITVDDASRCELPEDDSELWQQIAVACFARDLQPTPIISIKRLCSAEFRDVAAQRLASLPECTLRPILTPGNPITIEPTIDGVLPATLVAEPTQHLADERLDEALDNEPDAKWDDGLGDAPDDEDFDDADRLDDEDLSRLPKVLS